MILHGKPLGDADGGVRIATANLTGLEIELIQPLYGPGTHMEFLQKHGEGTHWDFLKIHGNGVHHLSFGQVDDHDQCIAALQQQGIVIDMAGPAGRGSRFSYMATQKDLGTIYELVYVPPGQNTGVQQADA